MNIIFMYRFSVTAECACPFFIEIIEIIEISRHIMGENKKNEKKLAFTLVFFRFLSISK